MRRLIMILGLLSFLLSCKKEDKLQDVKKKVSGVWEKEKVFGLITISLPPGNGDIIVLKENGALERKKHDTLIFSGSYSLLNKNDCYPRTENTIIQTTDGTELYIRLEDGKLVLSTSNCVADGGTVHYRRLP